MVASAKKKKDEEGYEVLELFGIKLKVKNPQLADLLTMEAKEALTSDISILSQKLHTPGEAAEEIIEEEIPLISEIESYDDYRQAINTVGEKLGFDVGLGGLWKSPTNVYILIRAIKEDLEFEEAKKYVRELEGQQKKLTNENVGLFVVGSNLGCDMFKAAIRGLNLYNKMRVISYENLNQILQFKESGYLGHKEVATLMVPLDNVDVGELINVIKAVVSS